jgi:farnesyl-diphosphate farnesyltransferase
MPPIRLNVDEHLQRTSRTFALAIPLLPEPTRRKVGLAYLLFRVADTLEDGELWSHAARAVALDEFLAALAEPSLAQALAARWAASPPIEHEGYVALLGAFAELLRDIVELDAPSRDVILHHGARTAEGMKETLLRGRKQDRLVLTSLSELQQYCYVVAGIVGELLTDLFLIDAPALESVRNVLQEHQVAFGEGLQLVNVLKDQNTDATAGRLFLPESVQSSDVFALARQDLERAQLYVDALRHGGAPPGFATFTGLSASLAVEALDLLEKQGPGAKLSRTDVQRIYTAVNATDARGQADAD